MRERSSTISWADAARRAAGNYTGPSSGELIMAAMELYVGGTLDAEELDRRVGEILGLPQRPTWQIAREVE